MKTDHHNYAAVGNWNGCSARIRWWLPALVVIGIYLGGSRISVCAEDSSTGPLKTQYHALLIGISNTEQDALNHQIEGVFPEMAELLAQKYGFNVQLLMGRDAKISNIEQSLRHYAQELSDRDSLLIIYAGATEIDEFLQESYWVVSNADESRGFLRSTQNWFSCNRVLKYVSAMNARHVLLVNDGDFVWNKQRGITLQGRRDIDALKWYQKVAAQPSRQILNRPLTATSEAPLFKILRQLFLNHDTDFIAGSELSLKYRDLTGDPGMEFGRLHDYKGSLQGDFVFHNRLRGHDSELSENIAFPYSDSSAGVAPVPDDGGHDGIVLQPNIEISDERDIPLNRLHALSGDLPAFAELNEIASHSDELIVENFGCEPTRDSLVGKAMRFGGRSYLKLRSPKFRNLAEGDFTIAFWMKADRLEDFPLVSLGKLDRGIGISCGSDGHLVFSCSGPSRTAHWRSIRTLEPLTIGKWYFVTLCKEGDTLEASLNKELQGSFSEEYATFSDNSESVFLGAVSSIEGSPKTFEGVIDEFRIYETALTARQLKALYAEKFQRFGVSPAYATDSEDLDKIARMSFGPRAKMADWRDLVNLFEGECESFMDAIGLEHWETAFVRCDGKKIWKDNRHFLVTRHSGTARDYYLVHETLDEHQLDLGSWFHTSCKVIIQKY